MEWLDDTAVNSFLSALADSTEDALMIGYSKIPEKTPKTIVCSSFYFESLRARGMECISQWLEGFNLSSVQTILFPLHSNSHWSLCYIHLPTGISVIFDSLRPSHKRLSKVLLTHSFVNLVIYSALTPQQTNGYDCGIYTLYYAACIIRNKHSRIFKAPPNKFSLYVRNHIKKTRRRESSLDD